MSFYSDLKLFVSENRLYSVIIGTVLASFVTEISYSVINNIIMPILTTDINNNKKDDMKDLQSWEVNIFSKKIYIGKFLYSFIRFAIILVILVYINKMKVRNTKK